MSENVKVTVEEFKRDPGRYLNEVGDNRSMAKADHYEGKTERVRIVGKVLL